MDEFWSAEYADSRMCWSALHNLENEDTPLESHLETLPVRTAPED